ncbi:MAG: hypothetical protein H7061_07790 [Bdellovibrionaceae bacterium]|nr:hypothetical protein [Bdellovibrio sp.]
MKMKKPIDQKNSRKTLAAFLLSFLVTVPTLAFDENSPGVVSIFGAGSFESPRFEFHNSNGVSTGVANIPEFQPSLWYVAQWKKINELQPGSMFRNSAHAVDPVLGVAKFAFPTANNESHIWTFEDPKTKKQVVELYGQHGWVDSVGGSNVFLQREIPDNENAKLDYPIELQLKAKISSRSILPNANAKPGAVMGQFISGFTVHYTDPLSGAVQNIFLQINHAESVGGDPVYRGCYRHGESIEMVYGANLNDKNFTSASANGPLENANYNINKYVCDLVTKPLDCTDGVKQWKHYFSADAKNLKNWKLNGYYIGIETQDRMGLSTNPQQGTAALAVQLSDVKILKDKSQAPYDCASYVAPPPPISTGQFCSGMHTIKWQCGGSGSPGAGWNQADNGCFHIDAGASETCGSPVVTVPTPAPVAPATPGTSGQFCSGTHEILWKCGLSQSPGATWKDAGGGCFHFDNGTALTCGGAQSPTPAPISNPVATIDAGTSNGQFCSGTTQVLWKCGVQQNAGAGWKDAGDGCYHYNSGAQPICSGSLPAPTPAPVPVPTPAPISSQPTSVGQFCDGTHEIKWQCGLSQPPRVAWKNAGSGCYHFDSGEAAACGGAVATPPPTSTVTTGQFCEGKQEIKWKCGLSQPPGPNWKNAGGGCFHLNNGLSVNCN